MKTTNALVREVAEQELEKVLDTYEIWDNDIDSDEFFNVILPIVESNIL